MDGGAVLSSESEDEVEDIERVPSPDVAPEESAAFYNPAVWYGLETQ